MPAWRFIKNNSLFLKSVCVINRLAIRRKFIERLKNVKIIEGFNFRIVLSLHPGVMFEVADGSISYPKPHLSRLAFTPQGVISTAVRIWIFFPEFYPIKKLFIGLSIFNF